MNDDHRKDRSAHSPSGARCRRATSPTGGPAGLGVRRARAAVVGVLLALAAVLGAVSTGSPATAQPASNVVRDWNARALAALSNPTSPTGGALPGAGQPPQVGVLHLAIVQLAVYDAVNSIDGGHAPYLAGLPDAPATASVDAAVATAAHDVLVGLRRQSPSGTVLVLPQAVRDWVDAVYQSELATMASGQSKDDGVAAGAAAAAAILAARDGDHRYAPQIAFTQGSAAGEWRAINGASDPNAWVMGVTPFTLTSLTQFPAPGPRHLSSAAYAQEYDEVKALGSKTSSRSPRQQVLADFYTVNPVELLNRALRGVTMAEGMGVVDEARFYATVNAAGADALIRCWVEKEAWHFWRPLTAIQAGDDDGNDRTVGDADWQSYIASPPYPDHISGYNCATASFMRAAQRFLGRPTADLRLTNLSTGVTLEYDRFSDVWADTIEARILQGLHFRSADVRGAQLGKQVADWVADTFFQPRP